MYHTIPVRGIHLLTDEGPSQERFNPRSYKEAEEKANSLGRSRRGDIKHVCLFFRTDKTRGGRISMWRRTSHGLVHGSRFEDLVIDGILEACVVCDHGSLEDNFFSYRNKRGKMTMIVRKKVADRIKDLAKECGLPPSSFSTHSGRHAFRTQQDRANQARRVLTESELNAAGRNEWTQSSVVGSTVYTGPSHMDFSNLRALEANLEGTIVTRTDTVMHLIAAGESLEGELNAVDESDALPPTPVVVVQDVDNGEFTMMGVPPGESSVAEEFSDVHEDASLNQDDDEEEEEEEDEEEDEEEENEGELVEEEGEVTPGWTDNIRRALETMMAGGLIRDLTAPGLAGLAGASMETRSKRDQQVSRRS